MKKTSILILFLNLIFNDLNAQKDTMTISEQCKLIGFVRACEIGIPLSDVVVNLTLVKTGQDFTILSDSNGNYSFRLDCRKFVDSIELMFAKEKYFTRKDGFGTDTNTMKTHIFRDLCLLEKDNVAFCPVFEISSLMYKSGSYFLDSTSKLELDKLSDFIKINKVVIEVSSHTDCIGSSSYNLRLSNKRTKAVVDYVVSQGVPKDNIFGKGYGETRPLNFCDCNKNKYSEEEHALNRRTEFRIVSGPDYSTNSF